MHTIELKISASAYQKFEHLIQAFEASELQVVSNRKYFEGRAHELQTRPVKKWFTHEEVQERILEAIEDIEDQDV